MKTLLLLFLFISVQAIAANDKAIVDANNQAAKAIEQQQFAQATDILQKNIGKTKDVPALQYNLGLSYLGLDQKEKGVQAYEQAAKSSVPSEARFAANFNLGEMAQKQNKTDEALHYYQQALNDNPDSVETKTNIELLIKQNQQQQQQQKQDKDDKDKKQDQNKQDKKDDKDQKGKGKDDKDQKDKKDGKDDQNKNQDKDGEQNKDKDQDKKDQPQSHQKSKPQPQPFKSDDLSQGDVKKILEELDRQEKRVRAEFNNKQVKERPRDKDW